MKKICVLVLNIFLSIASFDIDANMGPEGFYNFPNYYFVETGAFGGDGIAKAIETGNFVEIYSMEIDPNFVKDCMNRFQANVNVHIVQGDSGKDLGKMISQFNKPITFWLDGHNGTPDPYGAKNTPILEELNQIKYHPIKTHTILIDDMHCIGTILFDYLTKEQIIEKIMEINPDYIIDYMDGGNEGEYPNNIMIARVPSN